MMPLSSCRPTGAGVSRPLAAVVLVVLALLPATEAHAQFGGGFGGSQAVGGISIDTSGIVRNLEPGAIAELATKRRDALAKAGGRRTAASELRKVSLARVIAAVEAAATGGKPLPPEVLFLGGLERVTHLFVDPEGHDIVLAGAADAAVVDAAGNVVASNSRRPLLQLEDLVVALRAIDGARDGGMRCSIDPDPAGVTKVQQFLRDQKAVTGRPDATLRKMEELLGPQRVSVGGVPADSRLARVLVAADYRLKRIGMGLEPSGVTGLPSYVSMLTTAPAGGMLPRFWLEASYDPIARDPDELAWRIGGRRMTCLTENDIVGRDGTVRGAGGTDRRAATWCQAFTSHYDELAEKQPVFTELVNCVDLAVVAALIHGRQLDKRAGLDLAPLLDPVRVKVPAYDAPATVPTVASGLERGGRWVVSASGGVQFQPWAFASATADEADAALSTARGTALATRGGAGSCWWD
jgi:hypothetical protein